jgi:hypothetical protein
MIKEVVRGANHPVVLVDLAESSWDWKTRGSAADNPAYS